MARKSLKVAFGLFMVAVIFVFGLKSGAAAQPNAQSNSVQTIYPAGGSDGPPS